MALLERTGKWPFAAANATVPVIHMRARQNGCSLAQALAIH
ncbi:hypothetical protein FG93_00822 [Bosea sp. LC85]|nr:hypothetical protein [Bosea sp. LC85]KFC75062.1 hypothetical protein FG93_00822 [Bosea sp. LC85]